MVQSVLLFALGFLVATLLALVTAPVIWRRAQTIMRRRLEALVPMSLEEVRADRDALRAVHAMDAHKLEVEVAETRRLNAEQRIEIGRGREALKARNRSIEERDRELADLKSRLEGVSRQLRARELALSESELRQREQERNFRDTKTKLARTIETMREVEAESARSATAVAEREAELTRLGARLSELQDAGKRAEETIVALRSELDATRPLVGGAEAATDIEAGLRAETERASAAEIEAAGLRLRVDELTRTLAQSDGELRERIAELAAKVTRLAALAEGSGSPLPKLAADGEAGTLGARIAALLELDERGSSSAPLQMPRANENEFAEPANAPDELADDLLAEMDEAATSELMSGADEPDRERKAG